MKGCTMRYIKPHFVRYVIASPFLRAVFSWVLGKADTEAGLNMPVLLREMPI